MAAQTYQTVLDLARESLNDADKDRYSDATLLKHANDGTDEMFSLRPDLFLGFYSLDFATNGAQFALGDTLPFDSRFKRHLADYIVFRAEMVDDEHVVSGRAELSAKLFARIAG